MLKVLDKMIKGQNDSFEGNAERLGEKAEKRGRKSENMKALKTERPARIATQSVVGELKD